MILLISLLIQNYSDIKLDDFGDKVDVVVSSDLNFDKKTDLIVQIGFDLKIFLQTKEGFKKKEDQTLRFPAASFLWNVAKLPEDKTGQSIVITSSKGVHRFRFEQKDGFQGYDEKIIDLIIHPTLFEDKTTEKNPPFFADFTPDVNSDGFSDVALFTKEHLMIFVSCKDNLELVEKISFQQDKSLNMPMKHHSEVYERLLVPHMIFGDANNDKKQDIVMQKSGVIKTFLQNDKGRFNVEPKYSIRQEAQNSRRSYFKIDIMPIIKDLNGDGSLDFVMTYPLKHKTQIYYSKKDRINLIAPDEEIKIDGYIIFGTYFQDLTGDGRQDLALVVTKKPGLKEALDLFIQKILKVELFFFPMTDEGFSKEPKSQLSFEVPFSLHLSLRSGLPDLFFYPRLEGDFNKDGMNDLLVLASQQGPVKIYYGNKSKMINESPNKTINIDIPQDTIFTEPIVKDLNDDGVADIILNYTFLKDNRAQTKIEIQLSK